jgi:hypothetical protein
VKAKKPGLGSSLAHSHVLETRDDVLVVGIKGTGFDINRLENKESRDLIDQILAEVAGKKMRVTFQLLAREAGQKPARAASPKKPAPQDHDPAVQDVLNVFGGEVIDADGPAE